jgi:serine phosphatase RsbU (regulator of sigma subunit)
MLTRLNRYQLALSADELFTVLYAIVDPAAGDVCWANAGHPPPLLRGTAGRTRYLEGGDGLIGIEPAAYHEFSEPIASGEHLILYTDGLIERRGESLDVGMSRLAQAAESGPSDPESLCRHLLTGALPGERRLYDDVTIVVVQLN